MQHVDEGRLHAWLDGELPDEERAVERHLEECEACRARADEERRIRAAASAILLGADPGEIAMRRMVAVPTPRRPRRWVAVGWAASVLLALGVGWMARPAERAPVAVAPAPPRAPVGAPAPVQGTTDASPVSADAVTQPDAVTQAAPARTEERARSGAAPRRDDPPADFAGPVATVAVVPMPEAPPAEAPPPPPPPSPAPVAARARAAAESQPQAAERAGGTVTLRGRVRDAQGQALAGVQVTVPELAARTVTRPDGSYVLSLPADRVSTSDTIQVRASRVGLAAQSRSLAPESGTANFTMTPNSLALESVVVTGSETAWRSSAPAEAERALRYPLVIVPGLEVLGIDVGRVDGRTAVRVRQRLPGGETLTLTQRRATARADTTGAGITFRRGRLQVNATAPIPTDSIRSLF